MNKLIIVDIHNRCWANFYAIKNGLSYMGEETQVTFGLLRDIAALAQTFLTRQFCFTFDMGCSFRENVYPTYKHKRKQKSKEDPDHKKIRMRVAKQIRNIRDDILPSLGFNNIFYEDGYEADDLIASLCDSIKDEIVIVSSDTDLYQLILPRVKIYNKNELLTQDKFIKRYGIAPTFWTRVKAMAGCSSDDIEGIPGVGEKTAIRYIKGELPKTHKTFQAITSEHGCKIILRNLALVTLPYQGCPKFKVTEDIVNSKIWNKVVDKLGMESLKGKM